MSARVPEPSIRALSLGNRANVTRITNMMFDVVSDSQSDLDLKF